MKVNKILVREVKVLLIFSFIFLFYLINNISVIPETTQHTALAFKPTGPNSTITVETDKPSYVIGEAVDVSGKVDKVLEEKAVRLDIYAPDGTVYQSNIKSQPTSNGTYSAVILLSPVLGKSPGEYTILSTYNKQSNETKFNVRVAGANLSQISP